MPVVTGASGAYPIAGPGGCLEVASGTPHLTARHWQTATHLYSTGAQPAFSQGRRFVRLVFQKTKSSIFLLIIGRTIYNNLDEPRCNIRTQCIRARARDVTSFPRPFCFRSIPLTLRILSKSNYIPGQHILKNYSREQQQVSPVITNEHSRCGSQSSG